MSKFIVLFALLFSNVAFANLSGTWKGDFFINGKSCKTSQLEITQTEHTLSIYAGLDEYGYHTFECGTKAYKYYMWLEEDFALKGSEIWRYDAKMGDLTSQSIIAKDRFCDKSSCRDYDFIKITKIDDNKIKVWIDFDGAILNAELTK